MYFFKNFSDVELWEVLRISEWRKVEKNVRIISDGDVGRKFYILGHGSVKVLKKNRLLSILSKGDCFGEMAHLSEHVATRTTDVVSESDVTLFEINPEALNKASSECRFQFNDAFLRLLVRRLDEANIRISQMPNIRNEMKIQ
jgi:CRP-like cAMP-binding protein